MVCNMVLATCSTHLFSATSHLLCPRKWFFKVSRIFNFQTKKMQKRGPNGTRLEFFQRKLAMQQCNAKSSSYQHFYGKLLVESPTNHRKVSAYSHPNGITVSFSIPRNGEAKNSLDIFTPRPKKVFPFSLFYFQRTSAHRQVERFQNERFRQVIYN